MNSLAALDSLWRIWTQSYATFRGLFLWFTPFPYVSNMFVAPFVNIALISSVTRFSTGRSASDEVVVGMALLALSGIVLGGILQSFTYERDFGTFPVLIASRGSRLVAFWSRGALHSANGALAAVVTLLAAVVVFGVDTSAAELPTVLVAILISSISCTAFALFGGNFTLIVRNWLVFIGVANGLMISITGAVIPREAMPQFLQAIGSVLPLSHGLSALRAGFEGATIRGAAIPLTQELVVGVGYGIIGSFLYRWVEYRARVRGEFYE